MVEIDRETSPANPVKPGAGGTALPARILVVDDHPNVAAMLARVLSKFEVPVEVLTAHSGQEALDILKADPVDILITDFLMPGMNGLELAERVRQTSQGVHIILVTAYDTPGLDLTARRLNIKDFLLKPINPEKIREVVGKALRETRTRTVQDMVTPVRFRILVADDRADNVRLLTTRLASEGYAYLTAMDGEETLAKIRAERPDLVLMDVNMPKLDGFQVLREVRADPEIQNTPVIVVSAVRIGSKDIREGLGLGADDYVTKPIDWRELSARIQTKLRVKQVEDALRRRNQQLGMLPLIGQELSARLDVDELAWILLKRAAGTFGAEQGHLVIYQMDGEARHYLYPAEAPPPPGWEEGQQQVIGRGLAARVMALKRGLVVEDTRSSPYWVKIAGETTRAAMSAPLLGRGGVRGAVTLGHGETGFFSDEQLQLLQAIASQGAIAIENAQFYEEEHRRAQELAALNKVAQALNRFNHSGALYAQLAGLLREAFGFSLVTLWQHYQGSLRLVQAAAADEYSAWAADSALAPLLLLAPLKVVETRRTEILLEISPEDLAGEGSIQGRGNGAAGNGGVPGDGVRISTLAVPLAWAAEYTGDGIGQEKGELLGVLAVHSRYSNAFREADEVILQALATQIVTALERIRQYEAAEEKRQQMTAVLQAAADAILLVDEFDNVRLMNLAGERLFTDLERQAGRPLPRGRGYDGLLGFLDEARAAQTVHAGELAWPDGRTFATLVTPLENGSLVAVLHDVTHFKDLEHVKNEFIATASHDLKNPINAVMGYTDLLKQMGGLNEMQMEFVERVRRASVQMYELVLNLLEMARMEMDPGLRLEGHDLHDLLTNIVYEFQAQAAGKQQTLDYTAPTGRPQVRVDLGRIKQVLRNLVGNAIKYTPEQGQIRLFTTEEAGGRIWVQVQDTGLGIPEKDVPHIFEKFYRVSAEDRAEIQGNGLGLAIVRSIVEQHGGKIEVSSVHGEGSTFRFSLKRDGDGPAMEIRSL